MPDASLVDAVDSLIRAIGEFYSKSARPDDRRARDTHFDNELFDELSERGRPCTVAGISAPSHSTWALRYARAVALAVEKAIGRETVRWSDKGLTARKRETIAARETQVCDSLTRIPALPERKLAKIRARIESEFGKVHAARFKLGRAETTSKDGMTPLREIRLAVDEMLRAAVNVRELAGGEQLPKKAKDDDRASQAQTTRPSRKRSTERGEGRVKLIAALIEHHDYADGSCLNLDPIGNNELARKAEVAKRTASAFFKKEFLGHDKYKAQCTDSGRLIAGLKLLNGDFAPHHLYGNRPPQRVGARNQAEDE